MKKLFGRIGGKSKSAGFIVSHIPEHDTYVEPFAGGASVYWKKEPSSREVLADTDKDLIEAYKAVKQIDPDHVKQMNFKKNQDTFTKLLNSNPKTAEAKFYKYAYINYNSFGTNNKNLAPYDIRKKSDSNKFENIEAYQDRLKNTIIKLQSYDKTVKEYDSPTTFFYFDPPYYNTMRESYEGMTENFDWDVFADIVRNIKGKWMVSTNKEPHIRNLFRGYKFRIVKNTRIFDKGHDSNGGSIPFSEYLISNF